MPSAQQIAQHVWEYHQPELRKLYLEQDMTLEMIKTYMEEHHSFSASKGQYGAAFKKWDFRKNLNQLDWEFVNHQMKKRIQKRKAEPAVYLHGTLIPSKRVKKELGRRFTPVYTPLYATASSPKTPMGISVRTPGTPRNLASVSTPENPATFRVRLDNLPWFKFQGLLDSHTEFNQDWFTHGGKHRLRQQHGSLPVSPNTTYSLSPGFYFSPQSNWLEPYISQVPTMSHIGSSRDCSPVFGKEEHQLRGESGGIPASPGAANSTRSTPDFSAQTAQLELSANIATPATSSLFNKLIPSSIKPGSIEYIPTVYSCLQALSLERNEGDFLSSIQTLLGPFNHGALTEFLKFAAYLASNNMLSDDQTDQFLQWVIQTNNYSALRTFCSAKEPTIQAFARCIFESALRSGNAAIVRILLKAGVDPNPPTRTNGRTPLQIVAKNCNTELARILLNAGAEINATSYRYKQEKTALHSAVMYADIMTVQMLLEEGADINYVPECPVFAVAVHEDADPEIVKILLNTGANVEGPTYANDGTAMQIAARCGNVELVRLLLDRGADVNTPAPAYEDRHSLVDAAKGTVLQDVAFFEDHEFSVILAQILLDAGADANAPGILTMKYIDAEYDPRMTALQAAVDFGSVELVRMLLGAGADVNAPAGADPEGRYSANATGRTALQVASEAGSVELVQMLLDAGADVNAREHYNPTLPDDDDDDDDYDDDDYYGITALQRAARSGSAELVRMLLDAGADVNAPAASDWNNGYNSGITALEGGVQSGNIEVVQMLLNEGADVNDYSGQSTLSLAVQAPHNNIELVLILIAAGADINHECGMPVLVAAAEEGNMDVVELLLASGADVNAENNKTALEVAIMQNHSSLVRVLLSAGADVNAIPSGYERAALREAVKKDDVDMVRMLLDAGANVNVFYNNQNCRWVANSLPRAVEKGNIEMFELLLGAGAKVNACCKAMWKYKNGIYRKEWRTALLNATWGENFQMVKLLLDAGADVNATPHPRGGWTALQAAATRGSTELVQILLGVGANINAPAYYKCGRTALQAAIIEGHTKLVLLLLQAGADINAPAAETGGITALQGTAIIGQLGIALMLIQNGADPNAPPAKKDGRTALEGAAEYGRLDVLQLLLNAGADIGGRHAASARDLAAKNGHVVIAQLLEKF